MKYYAGIGSRKTPIDTLKFLTYIANKLASKDYVLRSGGAPGADSAFEKGAGDKSQIFVPWQGFQGKNLIFSLTEEAFLLAEKHHPVWKYLSHPVRMLMARNCMQVLGEDLKTPSEFVICWTPDGAENAEQRTARTGGTGMAIGLASKFEIPVYNIQNKKSYDKVMGIV